MGQLGTARRVTGGHLADRAATAGDGARIGYVPYRLDHGAPGDRRRFAFWAARRGVPLSRPDPGWGGDLVVLSARADISRWARCPPGPRLVYDLIDSYLAIPAGSPADLARGAGKTALRQHARFTPSFTRAVVAMCRRADAVVCSTPEQRAQILPHCPDVRVILDDHEHEIVPLPPQPRPAGGPLRLLWEGQPQNLRGMRPALLPALAVLGRELPIELHVVTDAAAARWFGRVGRVQTQRLLEGIPVPTTLHEWEPRRLARVAADCDVGVIPLDLEDPFATGKPENKMLILWRLGLPVVASATPAYRRAMAGAGDALTCADPQEWVAALRALAADQGRRQQAAARGRAYVQSRHSSAVVLAAWDELVRDLLGGGWPAARPAGAARPEQPTWG